ncbi:helix-turn-helix domain-containing protein [Minwuia sp.]|uniref:helix-turn-helix domain-containing protein n=1 Tax=Minwuia sp. TaxID=2493630 RepID=UPI003A90E009
MAFVPPFSQISDLGTPGVNEVWEATPASDLQGLVLRYQGYREITPSYFFHKMPADLFFPVIINFGSRWQISDRDGRETGFDSFVSGLQARFVTVRADAGACCLQVDLTPAGARAFFDLPLSELTSQSVDLFDLLGPAGVRLAEQLEALTRWPDRLAHVDRFVRQRLATGKALPTPIQFAWSRLRRDAGQVRIPEIAAELGWSREHFSRRFSAEFGLRPKSVARIMRFQQVLDRAQHGKRNWAAIAHEAGYADQAHLVREFRALSGETPTAFFASQNFNT